MFCNMLTCVKISLLLNPFHVKGLTHGVQISFKSPLATFNQTILHFLKAQELSQHITGSPQQELTLNFQKANISQHYKASQIRNSYFTAFTKLTVHGLNSCR